MTLAWVALGGALGTLACHGLSGWVYDRPGESFRWGPWSFELLRHATGEGPVNRRSARRGAFDELL